MAWTRAVRRGRVARFVALVVASGSVLLSSGCYLSHERRELDEPPEPSPAGRLELLLARAWCESMAECVRSGVFLFPLDEPLSRIDVELCIEHGVIRERARRVVAPWDAAIARGDGHLDETAIEGCLEAIRESTCLRHRVESDVEVGFDLGAPFGNGQPGLLAFDERCDAMYVVHEPRPVGATCEGPLDCERGAFCDRVGDDRCASECVSYSRAGDPCDGELFARERCRAPHLVCASGACELRPRTRLAGEGEDCGTVRDEHGVRDERCAPGLHCVFSWREDARRCVRASAREGERCSTVAGPWCVAPLLCVESPPLSDPPQTCRRLELATHEGTRCTPETNLRRPAPVCDPRAGLTCEPTSGFGAACVRRSPGGEGAWCSASRDVCARPLVCFDDACRGLPEAARCVSDDDCADGVCERGRCVRCE